MIKILTTIMLLSLSVIISGCEQKTLYPKKNKNETAPAKVTANKQQPHVEQPVNKEKTSDVGVSDFADYATGITPLKTKQFAKKGLNNSYDGSKNKLDEAMKEKLNAI